MRLQNHWVIKNKEAILLKIVEWCQKNNKKVEKIDFETLLEATTSSIRNV
jgi:hypothetical protein